MMLPALAVVFAVGGAIAGDFFSPVNAYYKLTATTCSTIQLTEQDNCQVTNDTQYPICTIKVGSSHPQAFNLSNCTQPLRDIQP